MNEWFEKVMALGNNNFRSGLKTFKITPLQSSITSGAVRPMLLAEAFNSKVKIFRSQMRGVRDRDFFIFASSNYTPEYLTFRSAQFNICTVISA